MYTGRLISSRLTPIYKQYSPPLWIGGVLLLVLGRAIAAESGFEALMVLTGGGMLLGIGWLSMKFFFLDLVDEVYDNGDWLMIRDGLTERRIPLDQIESVHYNWFMNPPRVTLRVRSENGATLDSIPVMSPFVLVPMITHPRVKDLMDRVRKV